MPDKVAAFQVVINLHSEDAERVLNSPQAVRDMIGEALEYVTLTGLDEEIDYTLEVTRIHVPERLRPEEKRK